MTDLLGPANAANSVTVRPADSRVFGGSDTWAKDASTPTSNDGTSWTAACFNGLLAQIRGAIRGMGITPDNTNDSMLLQAVQAATPPYAVDTGTADALVVNVNQPGFTLAAGSKIRVKLAATVLGPSTVALSNGATSLGTKTITRGDGGALNPYDWVAGQVLDLTYDGTNFQIPRGGEGGTGDLKWRLSGAIPTGWLALNGQTIGSASSTATHANADAQQLYTFVYTNFSDTLCPVTGGRGANAAADWTANKPIKIPDAMCRALVNIDAEGGAAASNRLSGVTFNSGGSATAAGSSGGEALHTLIINELPIDTANWGGNTTSAGTGAVNVPNANNMGHASGGGQAHNNMQPFLSAVLCVRL